MALLKRNLESLDDERSSQIATAAGVKCHCRQQAMEARIQQSEAEAEAVGRVSPLKPGNRKPGFLDSWIPRIRG